MKFSIGKGSSVYMNCQFDTAQHLSMGENSTINANCRIDTRGQVTMGANVSLSSDVIILTADHDMDSPDMNGRSRDVSIGDYVWVGTRVTIMPGVTIGRGAVIASGAVVTKSVGSFEVVAGVPAKFLRMRKSDTPFTYSAHHRRFFQ